MNIKIYIVLLLIIVLVKCGGSTSKNPNQVKFCYEYCSTVKIMGPYISGFSGSFKKYLNNADYNGICGSTLGCNCNSVKGKDYLIRTYGLRSYDYSLVTLTDKCKAKAL
jgi:hypothetical protein